MSNFIPTTKSSFVVTSFFSISRSIFAWLVITDATSALAKIGKKEIVKNNIKNFFMAVAF
jgi:hypothetical protein